MFRLLANTQAKERRGERIYHFEIGDSDLPVHPHITQAVKKALDNGRTHYVDSTGIIEFKRAISDDVEKRLEFKPSHGQILVMPSNAVIDFVVRCVADPGDEVIYPDPGFSTYRSVIKYTGVKGVGIPLHEKNGFHLKPIDIERRITDKTKLIIVNSPSNPTGAVLNEDEILEISLIAKKYNLYILSDEVYSKVVFDSRQHHSLGISDQCREHTIILEGFSKVYSMAGFRLGYAIGPEHVIEKMGLLFQTIFSCFPAFIQYGGISALTEHEDLTRQRIKTYEGLRDIIYEKINSIPNISCLRPEGALYVFPNITRTRMTSQQFCEFALERANIALLPGTCFGDYGEGHIRICYARKETMIVEAMDKLKRALQDTRIERLKLAHERI